MQDKLSLVVPGLQLLKLLRGASASKIRATAHIRGTDGRNRPKQHSNADEHEHVSALTSSYQYLMKLISRWFTQWSLSGQRVLLSWFDVVSFDMVCEKG